jgi:hypothetical protein
LHEFHETNSNEEGRANDYDAFDYVNGDFDKVVATATSTATKASSTTLTTSAVTGSPSTTAVTRSGVGGGGLPLINLATDSPPHVEREDEDSAPISCSIKFGAYVICGSKLNLDRLV